MGGQLHGVGLVRVVFSDELEVVFDDEFAVGGGRGQQVRLLELGDGVGEGEGEQQQLEHNFTDFHK